MRSLVITLALTTTACDTDGDKSLKRFASKDVSCAQGDARGVALCKRRGGQAYVCFTEHEGSTVYCIAAIDPLDVKPTAEVAP